ncbi:MAG: DUF3955 domain-containing protein [Clostridium sp.]|uniref:DUF3955 domain-containing protein n=1 Tax=Clostridium sp. TaxID=1506 RepID=UPI003060F11B
MKKNIFNAIPFIVSITCIIAYNIIGAEVLTDGTLVEPFYLIPLTFLFLFIGIIGLGIRGIFYLKNKKINI